MKKKLIKIIVGIVTVAIIILAFIWNRYFVKTSLFAEYISLEGQEVYILGTLHKSHFDKIFNYSMEDILSVVENVQPDVVFIEAREDTYEEYGAVDGPIDMNVVYSYCVEHSIATGLVDWWVIDNNFKSDTTSKLRDDNIFNNITEKLSEYGPDTTVLVVCGSGHFYPQSQRMRENGFEKATIKDKKSYFKSAQIEFSYPSCTSEVWEKRAYFYAYIQPEIVAQDENLNEEIKVQFTEGNHDAFYESQLKYCEMFEKNILFNE